MVNFYIRVFIAKFDSVESAQGGKQSGGWGRIYRAFNAVNFKGYVHVEFLNGQRSKVESRVFDL